jgi:hypothetical protein
MPELPSDITTTILRSLIIGVVAAWITFRLSLKQFKQQSWWQMKFEDYKRIIETMSEFRQILPELAGLLMSNQTPDQQKMLGETISRFTSIMENLDKAIATSGLVTEKGTADILRKLVALFKDNTLQDLITRRLSGMDMNSVHAVLKEKRVEVDRILEEFSTFARKDLKIESLK